MSDLFQEENPSQSATGHKRRLKVLVPFPVEKAYDYAVPDHLDINIGDYVSVPLGGRSTYGVVWGEGDDDLPDSKVKGIREVFALPPMPASQRSHIAWVAQYSCAPIGAVLKMALSAPTAFDPPKPVMAFKRGLTKDRKISAKQQQVLDVMQDDVARRASDIAQEAGVSAGVVKTMAKNGILNTVEVFDAPPCQNPSPHHAHVELFEGQRAAGEALVNAVKAEEFKPYLLDGVTGAGKTETYFEAVAQAIKQNKQVLILLPEIALSNAFISRFKERFGCMPALWHSSITPAKRRMTWRGVAMGQTKVVVGARSALFLPFKDLGLIIVDEEHDASYKQEEGVIYNARDMAIVRAHLEKSPIALVSATPSLETVHNVETGRFERLVLPSRFGGASLPDIHIVDLKADKPERQAFLSPVVIEAVREAIDNGTQALLYLNRRGYAPLTVCRTCGHRYECARCTAWLVEHRRSQKLHCHHCGYMMPIPEKCTECDDTDSLAPCGPGVERIHEEIQMHFPDARLAVLSSDTAQDNDALRKALDDIINHECDIIIGTQILAKGHHFPHLSCVGVVDADLGLHGGDLRAAERSYQMLHQVAGRAGREKGNRGSVYLQSYNPQSRVIEALASGDRDLFLETESQEREMAHMPPFSRLVAVIVKSQDEGKMQDFAKQLAMSAPHHEKLQTYGPAPAPIYRIRGFYRTRFLVHADKSVDVQAVVKGWLSSIKCPTSIKIQIDVDPQSFL